MREYPRLYRLFRQLDPAVVHTRNLAALEAVVPAWAAGVPVRIHGEHGWDMQDPAGKRRRYRHVRRLYRPFVNRYIALSHHLEDYLEQHVGIPLERISQIYNGVETERFRPSRGGRPAIPGCPFGEPGLWLIGTVGRMEGIKDPLNLTHAFVRAQALDPAAARQMRLIFVGDGALRAEAQQVLERAGMAERVWFAGERADVPDIMRGLDCFVLPSLAEGVSNTILEAMACGLPVVATRVGANAELVEQNVTGHTVSAADSDALAREIGVYFAAPALARQHGQAGRRRVERRFSLERMVEDYDRVYAGLLRTHRTVRAGAATAAPRPGVRS